MKKTMCKKCRFINLKSKSNLKTIVWYKSTEQLFQNS